MDIQELILKEYDKENYRIVNNNSKNGLCYIYASSNALYKKDDMDDFINRIEQSDRYEWENCKPKEIPEKEIYIRDIYLSWYVKGINSSINTYEKLIDFLKENTCGYEVRCVGVSSGGFICNIIAMELGAEICYCFAGQFSLKNHFDHLKKNILLKNYLEINGLYWFEYYERLKCTRDCATTIVYFLPNKSIQDVEQYKLIKDCPNVLTISINESNHGIAVYPFALPILLNYSLSKLKDLATLLTVEGETVRKLR